MTRLIIIVFFTIFLNGSLPAQIYKDSTRAIDLRVKDLLQRMTPEEKFWQLFMIPGEIQVSDSLLYKRGLFGFQVSATAAGDAGGQLLRYQTGESALVQAKKINGLQKYFVEKTRLGIPIIPFDEALHGLVRDGATAFPQAIAMAATWDTALMSKVAGAIAEETKRRGIRQVLSPVVNIANDVRWGRTEETYGEDPILAAAMGVAYVSAFEKRGIITTPKHFVANVADGGRDSYPVYYNERLLEEKYFVPFRACIEKGGSRSIMTAYNSLNGTAASSNDWLLTEKLKKQWGFRGFVISDANAVGGEVVLHATAKDYAASGVHALQGGLDVIFQTEYKHHNLFIAPFLNGGTDSNRINDAVARVLRAKFELGLFEHPYVSETSAYDETHRNLARQAAASSIVLLKNQRKVLPLSSTLRSIAVLGADATEARLGGYSGPGNQPVSILDGIKERAGTDIKVRYARGAERKKQELAIVPASQLVHGKERGLKADYFTNISMSGKPFVTRTDQQIDFRWTLFGPAAGMDADFYSVRWTGELIASNTGEFLIGLEGNDGFRLYINNKLLIDQWQKQGYHITTVPYRLEQGKSYSIKVEYYEPKGNATIKLLWNAGLVNDEKKKIAEAVALARQSDAAIVVAGIEEGEFRDRALLNLPGDQEELIRAVAATGKPLVVLLVGGSAITMQNWLDKADAVAMLWYPGEEGGHAVADILFGDKNPAGRLPISFPMHEGQLPLVYDHAPTGRGDDYDNLSGLPLFPFGYGLSYTKFSYDELTISPAAIGTNDTATVKFRITNAGDRAGEEVVQLYIRDQLSTVVTPVLSLKGFQRVWLDAGETKEITFSIAPDMLSLLNKEMQRVVEPGDFTIYIGASSADLRLKSKLTVR